MQSKNEHFIFWWLGGLKKHNCSTFVCSDCLGWSSEVEHNPKCYSISFFDDLGGSNWYFAHFSWAFALLRRSLSQLIRIVLGLTHVQHKSEYFKFFADPRGPTFAFWGGEGWCTEDQDLKQQITQPEPSEVECNPKHENFIFWWTLGAFFCILVKFCH